MSRDDDSLLSRWSRRKRAIADEEKAVLEEDAPAPVEPDEALPEKADDETEEATLVRLGLPSPESLGPGDDFTGFMKSGVPEYLRRRALRRLWRSNPVLANLDGLNDYDEDFNSAEETGKIFKSAYKIGRGFLKDDVDKANEAEPETAEQVEEEVASIIDDSDQETGVVDEAEAEPVEAEPQHLGDDQEVTREPPLNTEKSKPRRMRFGA